MLLLTPHYLHWGKEVAPFLPGEGISIIKLIIYNSWWLGVGLNHRHPDFQSGALPTELPSHKLNGGGYRT